MMYGGSKKKKKMMMYGGKKKMMQAGGNPEDRIKPKMMKDGGKLKMVMKDGKKVPFFAADGKGKMQMGGSPDVSRLNEKEKREARQAVIKRGRKKAKAPDKSIKKITRPGKVDSPGVKRMKKVPGVKMKKGGEKKMMMGGKKKMGMGGKKMMYQMGGFIEPGVFDLDRD